MIKEKEIVLPRKGSHMPRISKLEEPKRDTSPKGGPKREMSPKCGKRDTSPKGSKKCTCLPNSKFLLTFQTNAGKLWS